MNTCTSEGMCLDVWREHACKHSWDANFFHVLQQGDSGFVIVRNGLITFRSPVLQHFFDCPLQFGAVPEHTNASDYAEDADLFELAVQVCMFEMDTAALVCIIWHLWLFGCLSSQ